MGFASEELYKPPPNKPLQSQPPFHLHHHLPTAFTAKNHHRIVDLDSGDVTQIFVNQIPPLTEQIANKKNKQLDVDE